MMLDRRTFIKQVAVSAPAITVLTSLTKGAEAPQVTSQLPPASGDANAPGAGRGMMGRGMGRGGGQDAQMAGSPVGSQLPGQKWLAHDRNRPQPRKVTPGQPIPTPSAPSDAIVLFDGKDLSQWTGGGRGGASEPRWKIVDGHMEMSGGLTTKESFGDIQLHLEWMIPTGIDASRVGQQRGNSGVIFMGFYEVQVLSSFDNITYADGGAGGIYGLYPSMVNPCMPEGQWNTYDFVFEAPKFEEQKLIKPAFITLFFNGLVVHNKAELLGVTSRNPIATYTPHAPELPLTLQGHVGPAWYRNVWVRRLKGYDA